MTQRLMRLVKNLRFRKKLVISYILVAIIPLLILGLFSYTQANSFLVEQERRNLSEVTEKAADNVNYRFYKFNSVMEFITMHPRLVDIFNTRYTDMYREYQDISGTIVPMISTIKGMDSDITDIAVCTTNDFPELIGSIRHLDPTADTFWLEHPLSYTETNWYIEGAEVVGVRRLLHKAGSNIENILYLELGAASILEGTMALEAERFALVITDREGQAIYTRQNGLELPPEAIPEGAEAATLEIAAGGEKYLRFGAAIPAAGWNMHYYIPQNSLAVDARSIIDATALIICVCAALIILAVAMFSGAMLKRIDGLNRKMKQVSAGDLSVHIHSDSSDEVGELINGTGHMLDSLNSYRDEIVQKNLEQKEAEIKILQSQINPHLLYNSLSLVNWRAIAIEADDISLLTTTLAKYYRTMLNKGRRIIRVMDELENIRAYISIQLMMHDGSFEVEYDIGEGLAECYMLNFTLQPIVENAIEHGIDRKEDGPGKITVRARRELGALTVEVADNGPGMSPDVAKSVLVRQSPGYGLKNVNERIKLVFGAAWGLRLESAPGKGTRAIITLPDDVSPGDEHSARN